MVQHSMPSPGTTIGELTTTEQKRVAFCLMTSFVPGYRAKGNSLIICDLSGLLKKHDSMKKFTITILLRWIPEGGKEMLSDYNDKIPDYYPTMYLDGYTPEQIMYAAKRGMLQRYRERKAEQTVQTAMEAALRDLFKDWK